MLNSRSVIVVGFPIMLGILCLGLTDWLMAGAEQAREQDRQRHQAELEHLVSTATALLQEKTKMVHRDQEMALTQTQDKANHIADQAAKALAKGLAACLQPPASGDKQDDPAQRLLSLIGLSLPQKESTAAGPISALLSEAETLTQILPAGQGRLAIHSRDKALLWENCPPFTQRANIKLFQGTRQLSFMWEGKQCTWSLNVSLNTPRGPAPLTLAELATVLEASPQLGPLLGDGITLEINDLKTGKRQALPKGRPLIDEATPEDLGRWQEVGETQAGESCVRLLLANQHAQNDKIAFLAELAMVEPGSLAWGSTMIGQRPALALMPFLGLGLTIGAAIWAFNPKPERKSTRLAEPRELNLIRKGNRSVPEENRMLLADFDRSESINVRSLNNADDVIPPVKRESNLLRLRRLYKSDPGRNLNLEKQVRSDVLRGLLASVSTPAPSVPKPAKQQGTHYRSNRTSDQPEHKE